MSLIERARFLSEFALKPRVVGAVSPSSRGLAEKMVQWIDWPNVQAVVEYGPGTGAFTEHILSRIHPGTKFFAIEINPAFVARFAKRYPGVRVYQDSVKNVAALCGQEGIAQVDAIISGLPWASFCDRDQADFLDATAAVLAPGGRFATFAYLQGLLMPAGRRFKSRLRRYFSRIERSKTAWVNLPPAFVYRCRR